MNIRILKYKSLIFIGLMIIAEIVQYAIIVERGSLGGDFMFEDFGDFYIGHSLCIAIFIWCLTYALYKLTITKRAARLTISVNYAVLLIFIFNLIITVGGNVGNVVASSTTSLSFLTTIVPINYLILVNAQHSRPTRKFGIALVILILIDLHRLLLGQVMKVLYILGMRMKKLNLFLLIVSLPFSVLVVRELINYKLESRQIKVDNLDEVLVDVLSSRLAIINTVHYMADNAESLSLFCHGDRYSSPYTAAFLSLVPKRLFGISYVKTNNNCVIEHHVRGVVEDSSVNAPWVMTLYIEWCYGFVNFLSYFILTLLLLSCNIWMSNFLFGRGGSLFNLWFIFEFMWTGSILHLSIPFYFLSSMFFLYFLKSFYFFKNY